MNNNINIQEILKKYNIFPEMLKKSGLNLSSAIKEIVEAVVDKCAEKAKLSVKGINIGHDFEFTDTINVVNKESILNIKNMIDYGL